MRGRMPQHIQTLQSLRQHGFDLDRITVRLRIQGVREINFAAVDACGQGLPGNIPVELLQRLSDSGRARNLDRGTIFQLYVDLAHLSLKGPNKMQIAVPIRDFSFRSVWSEKFIEPAPGRSPGILESELSTFGPYWANKTFRKSKR